MIRELGGGGGMKPIRELVLTVVSAVPIVLFNIFFSVLGSGPRTYRWANDSNGYYGAIPAAVIPLLIYVLDGFSYWQDKPKLLATKRALLAITALCAVYAAIAGADSYPYMPVCVLVVFSALWIVVLWKVFFGGLDARDFLDNLALPLYANGLATLVWWAVHLASDPDHVWSKELQAELAFRSEGLAMNPLLDDFKYPGCVAKDIDLCASDANDEAAAALDVDFGPCLQAFVLWLTPALLGLVLIAAGYASQLVAELLTHHNEDEAASLISAETPEPVAAATEPASSAAAAAELGTADGGPTLVEIEADQDIAAENYCRDLALAAGCCTTSSGAPSAADQDSAGAAPADLKHEGSVSKLVRGSTEKAFKAVNRVGRGLTHVKDVKKGAHTLATVGAILLAVLWCAASVAGAGQGLATAIMATIFALCAAGFVVAVAVEGFNHAVEVTEHSNLVAGIVKTAENYKNGVQGLFVVTAAPVMVPCLLLISFLNQCVRRCSCFPYTKQFENDNVSDKEAEKHDWVTQFVRLKLEQMKKWAWTDVLCAAFYWGLLYNVLMVVASEFVILLLSWLINPFANGLGVGIVTVMIVAVGLVMFLLPPVPGLPIYLFGGILITAKGAGTFGEPGAICYTAGVCLGIKLSACAVQQKVFGEQLGGYVAVRQLVAVNSDTTRAMRLILMEPGLSPPKVAILLGGPDWPTSVLCGILKLPLGSILFATLPIIVVIFPMVMAGAFMYLDKYEWASSMVVVCAAVASAIQAACGA